MELDRASEAHLDAALSLERPKVVAKRKSCGRCPDDDNILCCCLVSVVAPRACHPCRFCDRSDDLYAEIPKSGDWDNGDFVMRIGCLCDMSWEAYDHWRTAFLPYAKAVREWNWMQKSYLPVEYAPRGQIDRRILQRILWHVNRLGRQWQKARILSG